jgi:predicted nuclease of predicted toxin-antitoxin system
MKFLIDAHLPKRLSVFLKQTGHDAIHTSDLPSGNRTKDSEIIRISLEEGRAVIT